MYCNDVMFPDLSKDFEYSVIITVRNYGQNSEDKNKTNKKKTELLLIFILFYLNHVSLVTEIKPVFNDIMFVTI